MDLQGTRQESYGEYRAFLSALGEDNSAQHQLLKKRLARALREELTPRQLQLVTMYYTDGLLIREIARELGITSSTVSRTLSRARARLRRCLRYGAGELLGDAAGQEERPARGARGR